MYFCYSNAGRGVRDALMCGCGLISGTRLPEFCFACSSRFYSSARLSVCVLLCFGGMYSECVYFCLVAVRNHAYVAQFGKFGGKVYFYAE